MAVITTSWERKGAGSSRVNVRGESPMMTQTPGHVRVSLVTACPPQHLMTMK